MHRSLTIGLKAREKCRDTQAITPIIYNEDMDTSTISTRLFFNLV